MSLHRLSHGLCMLTALAVSVSAVAAGGWLGAVSLAGADAAAAAGVPSHTLLLRQTQTETLVRRAQVDARLHGSAHLVSADIWGGREELVLKMALGSHIGLRGRGMRSSWWIVRWQNDTRTSGKMTQ